MINSERLLEEARRQNPALDKAYKRAEGVTDTFVTPLVDFFNRLEEEIAEMSIAQRFRRDKTPNFDASEKPGIVHPSVAHLSEAEYKRAQLLADFRRIRRNVLVEAGSIEGLVLDIEAAKTD